MLHKKEYYTESLTEFSKEHVFPSDADDSIQKIISAAEEQMNRTKRIYSSTRMDRFLVLIRQANFLADMQYLDITADRQNDFGVINLRGDALIFADTESPTGKQVKDIFIALCRAFDDVSICTRDGLIEIRMLYKCKRSIKQRIARI